MNVFGAIRSRSGPAVRYRLPQLCVFLQLTDAEGQGAGLIVGRRADSGSLVFHGPERNIQFRDRLQVKWVLFRLNDCPFPDPGLYWIQFYFNDQWVAEQTVSRLE